MALKSKGNHFQRVASHFSATGWGLALLLLLSPVSLFAQAGTVDPLFQTQISGGSVNAMTVQPDGKILVGGTFTNVNGVTKLRLARLNSDGSLDTNFKADILGSPVYVPNISEILLQTDGKIFLGGRFTNVAGLPRNMIARLNNDGSADTQFDAGTNQISASASGLCLQPDGKILVLGQFSVLASNTFKGLARLTSDGSVDSTFNPTNDFSYSNFSRPLTGALGLYADGTMLVGNTRLNQNGSNDLSFNCAVDLNTSYCDLCYCAQGGANRPLITASTLTGNNKWIIAGAFERINNTPRKHIARLTANGNVDPAFVTGTGANGIIYSMNTQADGKIIIGGCFGSFNNSTCQSIARLLPNGTLDTSFISTNHWSTYVQTTAIQHDGRILIGGSFTNIGGATHYNIARLKSEPLLYDHSWQSSNFSTHCATSTNRTYHLEYKNSLEEPTWNIAVSQAGNGFPQLFTDNAAIGAVRFYRIREE